MKRISLSVGVIVTIALIALTQVVTAQEITEESLLADLQVPYLEQWLSSGHADFESQSFRHWDEDDPAEVPIQCAKCHSSPGYQEYLGADGSEPNVIEHPAPVDTVVDCVACHNTVTSVKDSVIMPSGIELTGLGDEARCMECHQGRQSKISVDEAITEAGVDDDTVSEDLGFLNVHYYPAAATKFGTLAKGGYEYDGLAYDAEFAHVDGFSSCIQCHDSHTLELKISECSDCHEGVESAEDLRDVRMAGSLVDYDGDGDVEEGMYYELEDLKAQLFQNMQAYAEEIAGTPIVYNGSAYPYFFADTNADGEGDEGYASWTPRLLRAAYNYQVALKDPGEYAHGGKYIVQLLHDSIADLNSAIAEPIDMTAHRRIDAGHFASSEGAFRHWDEEGSVPGSCVKCHTDTGLPMFLAEGVTISQPPSSALACATCHDDLLEYTIYEVTEVKFPSGAVIDSGDAASNLCLNCHQGRESTVSVNNLTSDIGDDEVSDALRFLNIHYFAAGATRYGTEAKGAYEYADKEYLGFFEHDDDAAQCTDCHSTHGLEVDYNECADCHDDIDIESKEDLLNIRYYFEDWDGDGDDEEGLAGEIATLTEMLYAAMQDYAANVVGTPIVFDSHAYPYYFVDTDGNGEVNDDEASYGNQFNEWTPRLLRAAYNYQYVQKDPGAYVHNGQYIVQVLQDSLEDLGADISGMTRP